MSDSDGGASPLDAEHRGVAGAARALYELAETLRTEGGLVAGVVAPVAPPLLPHDVGARVAAGPRAADDPAAYAFVVEAIREGYLLHHGGPRLVHTTDVDLALLAGDRLYALGLERLAALGDTDAVAALADLIALSAQARAGGDADLAEAVWDAGVAQVGWGDTGALRAARERARAGDPSAARALRDAAREAAPPTASVGGTPGR